MHIEQITRTLFATGPVAANTWVEWDVTAAVQGNGTVNLAVMPTGTDGTVFYARDTSLAALRPQLVVTEETRTPQPPPPSRSDWTFYGVAQGGPKPGTGDNGGGGAEGRVP